MPFNSVFRLTIDKTINKWKFYSRKRFNLKVGLRWDARYQCDGKKNDEKIPNGIQ